MVVDDELTVLSRSAPRNGCMSGMSGTAACLRADNDPAVALVTAAQVDDDDDDSEPKG